MASERPVPTGPGAIELLRRFEEARKLQPEEVDAEILKIRAPTGRAAVAAATPEAVEEAPDRTLPFADAAKRLQEKAEFDLPAALASHVQNRIRCGHLKPDEAARYEAVLRTAEISERDLAQVIEGMNAGRKFFVAFQAVQETSASAFEGLKKAGVKTEPYVTVANFSHSGVSTRKKKGPSIIFTPADLNVPPDMGNRTADDWMRESRENGTDFVEPSEWCGLFEEALYTGMCELKGKATIDAMEPVAYRKLCAETLADENSGIDPYLLDVRTVTLCPAHRDNSGSVLGLGFDPLRGYRRVGADGWNPRVPGPRLGPRVALGRVRRGEAAK